QIEIRLTAERTIRIADCYRHPRPIQRCQTTSSSAYGHQRTSRLAQFVIGHYVLIQSMLTGHAANDWVGIRASRDRDSVRYKSSRFMDGLNLQNMRTGDSAVKLNATGASFQQPRSHTLGGRMLTNPPIGSFIKRRKCL